MRFPLALTMKIAGHLLRHKLLGTKRFSTVLQLEPLHTCNLTCTGCGRIREYSTSMKDVMPLEDCLEAAVECNAPMVSICGGEPLIYPRIEALVNEVFDPFRPGQMEPYGSPLPVPMDLESEKRAAPSFQLNPFDQLIDANLFGVHLEGIAVRQLAPFPNRVAERLDEPLVARPFLRGY